MTEKATEQALAQADGFFTVSAQTPNGRQELRLPVRLPLPDKNGVAHTLAHTIYLSGLFTPPALCSGLGRCGRCRIRYLKDAPPPLPKENAVFSLEELAAGWRLGCLRPPQSGLCLELPPSQHVLQTLCPVLVDKGEPVPKGYTDLAVDFGSTSLQYSFVRSGLASQEKTELAQTESEPNPQLGAGSDIMSRLALAAQPEGLQLLHSLSLKALQRHAAACGPLREICLAANPAMTYLLLGKDVRGLTAAPYSLTYKGGCVESLPGLPPLWVAPLIAPFIGGDAAAGYAALALGRTKPEYPFMLADLGTNGEFILALGPNEALAASIPLGPALEGIGLACGSEARPGAVTGFTLSPYGLRPQNFKAAAPLLRETPGTNLSAITSLGISGTGYLQLLCILRKNGLMDAQGHFSQSPIAGKSASPLTMRLARNFYRASLKGPGLPDELLFAVSDHACKEPLHCPSCAPKNKPHEENSTQSAPPDKTPLFLSAGDVEEILKIKAAFSLAAKVLLERAGLSFSALRHFFLAGALGLHAPQEALEELGFLPQGLGGKVQAVGNTALAGARLLLEAPQQRALLVAWAEQVRTINLAEDALFMQNFVESMHFNH